MHSRIVSYLTAGIIMGMLAYPLGIAAGLLYMVLAWILGSILIGELINKYYLGRK